MTCQTFVVNTSNRPLSVPLIWGADTGNNLPSGRYTEAGPFPNFSYPVGRILAFVQFCGCQ
jgi:hypothetical protein